MNNNYFRITAYLPTKDLSIIIDSNGVYEKLWQFSSDLIQKGFEIIAVSNLDNIIDINIEKAEPSAEKLILRATAPGKPENITHLEYHALKVNNKIYVPSKEKKA